MEARIAHARSDGEKQVKEARFKAEGEIGEIRTGVEAEERDAKIKISGYKKAEEEASRKAGEAVAKKEEAESAYEAYKEKMLV